MKKMENREVEVKYCDFCGEETQYLSRCAICKREMCNKDAGAFHSAFSVEIYRYEDGHRLVGDGSKICNNCAEKKFDGTIRDFINGMIDKDPVSVG